VENVHLKGRMIDAGGITYRNASATYLVTPDTADPASF
jgi:hypothetical protein